ADSRVETLRRLYGSDFVVDESIWRGRAAGRPFGLEGRNRPLEFRLLHVLQFAENGEIARENVWLDFAAILAQLPQQGSACAPKPGGAPTGCGAPARTCCRPGRA